MLACFELVEKLRAGLSPPCPTYPATSERRQIIFHHQSLITNHAASPLPLSLLTNHFSPLTAALAALALPLPELS